MIEKHERDRKLRNGQLLCSSKVLIPSLHRGSKLRVPSSEPSRCFEVVSHATRSRLRQIKAHKIHHGKGIDVHLSLAVVLSTIQSTPIRKDTMHLQTSMSSPGFEPRPYGTAVGVANPLYRMGDCFEVRSQTNSLQSVALDDNHSTAHIT
ncbi:hypothetical protein TNCV_4825121 [Trichonephila clavipes]|uniref:Uncharacterized protein n=1 Tax=Trichonephila clavipes TaxID=2585209 RepID=A0A8X6RML3_TRICX|nr:hypothetical protein TNCV_4825121 [Trichonephila clavipes]